jgi:hypothetical protein
MPNPKSPVALNGRLEPLIDDWLIESQTNVSLRLTPPRREEIVLLTDKPWEGSVCSYFVVLQDGPVTRLYYRGMHGISAPDEAPEQATCYAESSDGIHFERPNLGLYEFEGSRENNILLIGPEAHNFAPFIDTNPSSHPDERFKAVGGVADGLFAFTSPDGIHWHKKQEAPIITVGELDSLNIVFWDESISQYRCYARYFDRTEPGTDIRAIWSMTSPDFVNWSEPQKNLYAAHVPLEQFYTNATVPLPNAPHILLSFPMRFLPMRQKVAEHPHPGLCDAVLISSRDGIHWDRPFREAWIRPGRGLHNWTERSNMTARGIIQTAEDEFSLYVSENYRWPDHGLRRYSVRRDGFASLHATHSIGEWMTRPLMVDGSKLTLNYSTSAAGWIGVEVLDESGKPLAGYELADMEPIYGDELDATICWKNKTDLSELQGQTVRLRFVMSDADIYALRLAP